MSLKMLAEDLMRRECEPMPEDVRSAIDDLLRLVEHHRPLGTNGKHRDHHTLTCGCDPDDVDQWMRRMHR